MNGYSAVYGARPLKRLVQSELLNQLALMLLEGRIRAGEEVKVTVQANAIKVMPNHEPLAKPELNNAEALLSIGEK